MSNQTYSNKVSPGIILDQLDPYPGLTIKALQSRIAELESRNLEHQLNNDGLHAECMRVKAIATEQRRKLEVLCEGTDGSTPAIVTIARLRDELESQGRWVPVSERLPDSDREVEIAFWTSIAWGRNFYQFTLGKWHGDGDIIIHNLPDFWRETAPLPEPPGDKT